MQIYKLVVSCFLASICSVQANAQKSVESKTQTVITTDCLLKDSGIKYQSLAHIGEYNLIKAQELELDKLIYEGGIKKKACGKYLDVTPEWDSKATSDAAFLQNQLQMSAKAKAQIQSLDHTYEIKNQKIVQELIAKIEKSNYWENLERLTDPNTFPDRSASTKHGVKAANWLKEEIEKLAIAANRTDVEARLVDTAGYIQPSLVVKIGTQSSQVPGIVVGAHMDTLSSNWFGYKPGADDDGTGSVTVLELAKILFNSSVRFDKPIYLAWYAAEERGLVGSKYVVRDFKAKNIKVANVLHLDMTGYQASGDQDRLWLINDNVDPALTDFLEKLAHKYSDIKDVKRTRCNYACSDHASWTSGGFSAAMPSEAAMDSYNPDIHTSSDTMRNLSPDQMLKFAKLAVAFVGELAEPNS